MSAKNFKARDKVKVRKGLVAGMFYDDVRCNSSMAKMGGRVLTIRGVYGDYYEVEEHVFCWSDEMLEPVEKTLDNLCAGDYIKSGDEIKKVLAALDSYYLLSDLRTYDIADKWYTAEQLKVDGFEFFDPQVKAIEINGKMYNEVDVEKAIEDLEPIE